MPGKIVWQLGDASLEFIRTLFIPPLFVCVTELQLPSAVQLGLQLRAPGAVTASAEAVCMKQPGNKELHFGVLDCSLLLYSNLGLAEV